MLMSATDRFPPHGALVLKTVPLVKFPATHQVKPSFVINVAFLTGSYRMVCWLATDVTARPGHSTTAPATSKRPAKPIKITPGFFMIGNCRLTQYPSANWLESWNTWIVCISSPVVCQPCFAPNGPLGQQLRLAGKSPGDSNRPFTIPRWHPPAFGVRLDRPQPAVRPPSNYQPVCHRPAIRSAPVPAKAKPNQISGPSIPASTPPQNHLAGHSHSCHAPTLIRSLA